MSIPSCVLVLGASGSVGDALVRQLISDRSLQPIITLGRRPQPQQSALARQGDVELREIVLAEMTPAAVETATIAAIQEMSKRACGCSVLGVGAGTAKLTLQQHRAVDVELNAAFARGLMRSGKVEHLALMSAVGANPRSATWGPGSAGLPRYARVKGEAEQKVRAEGPEIVSILRPATIVGSRHTPSFAAKLSALSDKVLPANFHSITTEQIARAMVALSRNPPGASAVYHHTEMLALQD